MNKTPLYENHLALNAKLVDFAGFQMPIQYSSISDEHKQVRNSAGIFDVSHMGEIIIKGNEAQKFLDRILINDIKKIDIWQAQYSAMCFEDGGLIDDIIVYRYPDHYMLVVNASNIEKDYDWLIANKEEDIDILNLSDKINILAIQGPKSRYVLEKLTDKAISALRFYHFYIGELLGEKVMISRTGYTGELGFEIYAGYRQTQKIWSAIIDDEEGLVRPVGLGCRDTLRIEMKYLLYGNDISSKINPIEAGLGWITKLTDREFIGCESIGHINNNQKMNLVCIEMIDKGIPRPGYEIAHNQANIGRVTSGTFSPSLEKGIGLVYILKEFSQPDTELDVIIRNKNLKCKIVNPPFYKRGSLRE